MKVRFGFRSAYHEFTDLDLGSEADMALWWRNNGEAGYNCDFILVPVTWRSDT